MTDFRTHFGAEPDVQASAPGRVNLIGEHTDYNDGFVLPTAIPQRTAVELTRQRGDTVRVASAQESGQMETYRLGEERPGETWLSYVQGTTALLTREGHSLTGFDAFVASDVPVGSGLSSSAALLVALMRALREAFGLHLEDVAIALLAQRVENEFAGARVGVMDPMASSLAGPEAALFLDTQSMAYERIAFDPARMSFAVVSSGVQHRNAGGGGYNQRRAECEAACAHLGVPTLRALTEADLGRIATLPEPLGRRARHVVTENARVLAAVAALRAGDGPALGRLFSESHASMRDDYEVSIPEIDTLVRLLEAQPGVFGARLTGGGFGGSVVAVGEPAAVAESARRAARDYADETGETPVVLVPDPSAG